MAATVPRVNPPETAVPTLPETIIKAPRRWGWPSGREFWEYRDLLYGVTITGQGEQQPLMNLYSETAGARFHEVSARGEVRCHIDRCPLPAGQYVAGVWADEHQQMLDAVPRASDLTVAGGDFYGSGREQMGPRTVLVQHDWSIQDLPSDGDARGATGPRALVN